MVLPAETGDVPGTDIGFLAHPSAYRPPSGNRVFMTTTANKQAGPGWTQGYWQTNGTVAAVAAAPTVNGSNAVVKGTAFTGRMLVTPGDGRLLMSIGMAKGTVGNYLLENKNLEVRRTAAPSHRRTVAPSHC